MNESPRNVFALRLFIALSMMLCITATMIGARGQDKNAGGLRIATIDLQRLQSEYKQIDSFKKQVSQKQQALNDELQIWSQNPFLTPQEQASLVTLKTKENSPAGLTNAEKDQKKKLEDQSAGLNNEFNTLQQTPVGQIQPAQKARLESLIRMGNENDGRIEARKKEVSDSVNKEGVSLAETAQKSMREALAKIAKDRGYSLVLSTEVAPYASDDVTSDVIKQLNK